MKLIYANDRTTTRGGYICVWDVHDTDKIRFEPVNVTHVDLSLDEARNLHAALGKFFDDEVPERGDKIMITKLEDGTIVCIGFPTTDEIRIISEDEWKKEFQDVIDKSASWDEGPGLVNFYDNLRDIFPC